MLAAAARLRRREDFTATVRSGRRATRGALVVHLMLPPDTEMTLRIAAAATHTKVAAAAVDQSASADDIGATGDTAPGVAATDQAAVAADPLGRTVSTAVATDQGMAEAGTAVGAAAALDRAAGADLDADTVHRSTDVARGNTGTVSHITDTARRSTDAARGDIDTARRGTDVASVDAGTAAAETADTPAVTAGQTASPRDRAISARLEGPPSRAGFVVSKAVGDAVTRNKVKRRLRHLVRAELAALPPGTDIVVRALPEAASRSYPQLELDLREGVAAALRRGGRR